MVIQIRKPAKDGGVSGQAIMEDDDKLDNIQNGFIHYQLIRFCQATRRQYLNGQIDLAIKTASSSSMSN